MKLYDVPNNTKVRVLAGQRVPTGQPPVPSGTELLFTHIDGMFSLCYDGDKPIHIAAWTEVEIVE